MSWPNHHQLFFGGQSVRASTKPTVVSLVSTRWLPGTFNVRNWSQNSQSFDVWRTLTATDVKGYRNRVSCISQMMRPQGPLMPCTPKMLPSKYCQYSQSKLEKHQILVYEWGDAAPCDPHQSLFRGTCVNKMRHFLHVYLFNTLWKP